MYYTYVLSCKDKSHKEAFYIGYSKDLKNRYKEHSTKKVKATKEYIKIELIYYEACLEKIDAIKREKQLKTGFGRSYLKRRLESYLKRGIS